MENSEILLQILSEVKDVKGGQEQIIRKIDEVEQRLDKLEDDVKEVKQELKEVKHLAQVTFEQTAMLTEFRTETLARLDKIEADIELLNEKELQNEQDIFIIKRNLKVV